MFQTGCFGVLNQATHRTPMIGDLVIKLFLLLGPPFMTGDGQKMVHFGPKMAKHGRLVNVTKWSKRVQKGSKGTKMVNLSVFDHLEPYWAHLDPFQPFQAKMIFLPQMDKIGFCRGALEQNINFCLKWS